MSSPRRGGRRLFAPGGSKILTGLAGAKRWKMPQTPQEIQDLAGVAGKAINDNNPALYKQLTETPLGKAASAVLENPELIRMAGTVIGMMSKLKMHPAGSTVVPDADGTPSNTNASAGWAPVSGADPTGASSLVTPKRLRFVTNRIKSSVLKQAAKLHGPQKVYTYKSQMLDKYRFHAGGNVKGIIAPFLTGPPQYAATQSTVLSLLTYTGSPAAPFSTGSQDDAYPFVWSTQDDQAIVKSLISGTAGALLNQVSSTDGAAGFPVQSKHIAFTVYNSNRYLTCELTVMLVKRRLGGSYSPVTSWLSLPSVAQDVNKMSSSYVKYVENLTPVPDGSTFTPLGEVSVCLEASPGLSSEFTKQWEIVQVKKVILAAGGSVNLEHVDEMSRPMMTTAIVNNAPQIYPEGATGFMMTFKGVEPVVCVKNSEVANNAQYDFVLRSAPIRLRVANMRKWAVCSANSNQTNTGNTVWLSSMQNLMAPRQYVVDTTAITFAYQSQYGSTPGAADSKFAIPLLSDKVQVNAGPMVTST